MGKDPQEQLHRRLFTGPHAPLSDISYCLDAAAAQTDLIYCNITGVLYQCEDG